MTRLPGGRRRPDDWASPHDRARMLLAERLLEPLEPAVAVWLESHLVDCEHCRDVDTEYRSGQRALRELAPPVPPRDLWARTAAAIEAEERRAAGHEAGRRWFRGPGAVGWTRSSLVAGLAVAAVTGALVGSFLGPALFNPSVALATPGPGSSPRIAGLATPILVAGGNVAWLSRSADGSYRVNRAPVHEVCPEGSTIDCTPIDAHADSIALVGVSPHSVYASPVQGQVVVLGRTAGSTALSMFVMSVDVRPNPTSGPVQGQGPGPGGSSSPSASGAVIVPTSAPRGTAPATPAPTSQGPTRPTVPPVSASVEPSLTESPGPEASETPSGTPNPSDVVAPAVPSAPPAAATAVAVVSIAADLTILGERAAYSPDGMWFAFTARAATEPTGSDVYVWRSGDPFALAATTDHRSVFSGWVGGAIIGSRALLPDVAAAPSASPSEPASNAASSPTPEPTPMPTPTASPASSDLSSSPSPSGSGVVPTPSIEYPVSSFLIDPMSLVETPLALPAWRPVVDPTGTLVAYWQGTVMADPLTGGWTTGNGQLVLASWPAVLGAAATTPGASSIPAPASSIPAPASSSTPVVEATPAQTDAPVATTDASIAPDTSPAAGSQEPGLSAEPLPSASPGFIATALPPELGSGAGVGWDLRWDQTGRYLAVWIGDRADPSFGHLALLAIDPLTGTMAATGAVVSARAALPGFALTEGYLAWATPPGEDGLGSRLVVYAWSGPDAGRISSQAASGTDPVIVVQP